MKVSIIIPVFKEGMDLYYRIISFREKLASVAEKYGIHFEIFLVTDFFHSPTLKAMSLLARRGIARSFLLTRRIGKGGSIKNAISYAHGDYVILLDADIPVSPETLVKAVGLVYANKVEVLIANRVHRTHTVLRQTLSTAYNTLVNILFRTGLRDHQAGFKILSRRAARIILAGFTRTDGLAYDTEIIVWARKLKLRYGTINVSWLEKRKGSTIPSLRALLTMLADLIMLRLLPLGGKYVALQRIPIGKVVDLPSLKTLGIQYMTVIKASGPKKYILDVLRKLYVTVAFKKE